MIEEASSPEPTVKVFATAAVEITVERVKRVPVDIVGAVIKPARIVFPVIDKEDPKPTEFTVLNPLLKTTAPVVSSVVVTIDEVVIALETKATTVCRSCVEIEVEA